MADYVPTYSEDQGINTDLIFGAMSPDLQEAASYDALNSVYASSFDMMTPIQEKSERAVQPAAWTPGRSVNAYERTLDDYRTAPDRQVPQLMGELFNDFTRLSQAKPKEYQDLQMQLYLGGFFGKTKLENIQFGLNDDASYGAFSDLLSRVARINSANKEKGMPTIRWQDLLSDAVRKNGPDMEEEAAGKGQSVTISLADPTGLAMALDRVAQNTIGRRASADEQRMFVSTFHAMQSGAQAGAATKAGTVCSSCGVV